MELVIDSREHFLKIELEKLNCTFSIEQLTVGDAIFRDVDKTHLICERKTRSDFLSSIKSGRYSEQRERIKSTGIKSVYIVEGAAGEDLWTKDRDIALVNGALENLVLYHNIFILPTASTSGTAKMLCNMLKKVQDKQCTPAQNSYISPERPIQRKEKLMDKIFLQQLSLITGLSTKAALQIIKIYPSVKSLVDAYKDLDEKSASLLLADIKVSDNRKLGPKLSKRIQEVYTC